MHDGTTNYTLTDVIHCTLELWEGLSNEDHFHSTSSQLLEEGD